MRYKIGSLWALTLATVFLLTINGPSLAQSPDRSFVPPPRTIADIAAILDEEKPDPARLAKMQAEANAEPPGGGKGEVAQFLYQRCQSRAQLGDSKSALADCEKAVELARSSLEMRAQTRLRQGLAGQYSAAGDPKKALAVFLEMTSTVGARDVRNGKGFLFNAHRQITECYIQLGDFAQAEIYVRRNDALIREARGWGNVGPFVRASWEGDVEWGRAALYEARGQFHEAEAAYARALAQKGQMPRLLSTFPPGGIPPPLSQLQRANDRLLALQGRMKARQGRIAEGEADVRRALLNRLNATGKYNLQTSQHIGWLANLLVEQGRFAEAERLTRAQLDIIRALGAPKDSQIYAATLSQLASIVNLQGRWKEASALYVEVDEAIKNWEPARRELLELNTEHIVALYNTNNLDAGLSAAEQLLARQIKRYGDNHIETALTRGLLAIGLYRGNQDSDALREFKTAIPVLLARSRETDEDDAATVAAREQRTQFVIETYIALLARMGSAAGIDAAAEGFRLADTLRGQSVQRALESSSARSVAANPALAEVVRKEQDLEKQIGAQLGLLNNVLSLPPDQRDEKSIKALQADIDKMREARAAAKREIAGKFRNYASLIDPPPPTVQDIRALLRDDEAYLSFYFGREHSFVWAVTKTGPLAFATIAERSGAIDAKIGKLREALEPNAVMISDIPPFDVAAAYELYSLLLKPVEAGWKSAKSLIVTTNGALGLLPLGLLPTGPSTLKADLVPYFSAYRDVPWLARTYAVTLVPSAAAFHTLRQLPPGSDKRQQMIGFGDPIFNAEQAKEDAAQPMTVASASTGEVTMRGLPLKRRAAPQTDSKNSATLKDLPRLPDTAEELKSIALALQADPAKALKLGKAANEQTVKTADLSKYRIIAFATHGLVPGELDGLHEPALALTAPDVAGVPGDGLLTMGEILALKLNADWVVLSACNTATGSGAGAEAASGLGRAFFYAGTRAILVTNWSVHSQSARELVTDLFARQTANPKLSRGEALRQAMMALMDGNGFTNEKGETLFTYAHPLFWAPYTIIGDGG